MERWEYRTIKFKTGGFWGGRVDNSEFQGASRDIIVVFKRKLIGS